jgi:hypothetical protein
VKSKIKRKKIELELAEFDMEDIEFEAQQCINVFNQTFIHESKLKENEEARKKEEEFENLSDVEKTEMKKQSEEERKGNSDTREGANKNASKEAKTLFKKIAVETHPDKLSQASKEERELKSRYFLKAQKAIENNDLASLLEVANKLNIDSGLVAEEEIKIIETKIDFIRKKVHEMKQTAAWIWHHSSGEQKDNIEKQLIGQMGFKKIGA